MTQTALQYVQLAVTKTGEQLKLKNKHTYPRIEKIVVHLGYGKDRSNNSLIETLAKHLAKITGQKVSHRKAKKSIASFKLREGELIGMMTTLRSKKMADFLSKLIHATLPSIRDFRGLPLKGFDHHGNYSLGIKEHTVFSFFFFF